MMCPPQMRAVAEATINELKDRLKDRQKALDDLERLFGDEKARWQAQHEADRAEILALNQRLFEHNDASIGKLKVRARAGSCSSAAVARPLRSLVACAGSARCAQDQLSRIPGVDSGVTGALEADTLRKQMGQQSDELAALRAKIEQQEADRRVLEKAHSEEVIDQPLAPGPGDESMRPR